MSRRDEKLEALFEAALALEAGEQRRAYLDGACPDPDLRRQVESLLEAHRNADTLLAQEIAEPKHGPMSQPVLEQPGDTIGRYKLLEKLGEGGFGVVYMAEQREPVKRRVALKIIKMGMDTREVVARFEAERQALALMDHPNIAKIHDAGATETGRPYFVMELVRGIKLTDYCDERNVSTGERLDLFVQVCQAVQHAHQKGIIHRDLKPSNILVTVNDGKAVPKIIDFGIAKATQMELTEKTVFTRFHQFIGTPAYMSPEQADISSVDVDTRSDIYSLGVLLYELLTGKTPFDARELLESGLEEMRRTIREKEPERPSTRVSTLRGEELTTTARRRGLDAPKLIHVLRGDLDWIVMKCLEKDRSRRYETANGLAADLRRHLSNEPVVACPPSAAYRFGKMVRRNRVAFAAAGTVAATLFIGLSLSTILFFRERAARSRAVAAEEQQTRLRQQSENALAKAETAEKKATEEAAIAKAVSDFLRSDLLQTAGNDYQVEYLKAPANPNLTMTEALDRAAKRVKDRFRNQPLVEAAIRMTIGVTYNDLGEPWAAIPQLERALDIHRARLGPEHKETRQTMCAMADAYLAAGRATDALPLYQDCARLARGLFGEDHVETHLAVHNLGSCYVRAGRANEAVQLLEELRRRDEAKPGPRTRSMAATLTALAGAYGAAGQPAKAIELSEEALRIDRGLPGVEHPARITAVHNLAVSYLEAGRTNDALPLLEEKLRLKRTNDGEDNPSLLNTIGLLVGVYRSLGRNPEAEALVHESDQIAGKPQNKSPVQLLRSLRYQANYLRDRGRFSEAEPLYREAVQLARSDAIDARQLSASLEALADVLSSQRRYTEAELLYRERLGQARQQETNASPKLEGPLRDLADVLYRGGKYAEAEPLYREYVQSLRRRHSISNENVLSASASLGRLLADWAWEEREIDSAARKAEAVERAREAERILRECLPFRTRGARASRGRLGDTQSRLAVAVLALAFTEPGLTTRERAARIGEAETLLLEGEDLMQQSTSIDSKYQRDGRERLVRLYEAWEEMAPNSGHAEKAAEWKRKLGELNQKPATEAPPDGADP